MKDMENFKNYVEGLWKNKLKKPRLTIISMQKHGICDLDNFKTSDNPQIWSNLLMKLYEAIICDFNHDYMTKVLCDYDLMSTWLIVILK